MFVALILVLEKSSVTVTLMLMVIVQHLPSAYLLSFALPLSASMYSIQVRRAAWRNCCQGCSRRWTPSVLSWSHCGARRWSSRDRGTSWGSRGRIWRFSWHGSARRPREGTAWARKNDRCTTHIPSPLIVFKLSLFRVQISNTCHSTDDSCM